MTEAEIADGILRYLRDEIAYPGTEVTRDTALLDSGVLDSLALLRLVLHLETAHGITFAPEDLDPCVFERIPAIASLVQRRLGAAA